MGSKFLDNFPQIAQEMLKLFPEDTTFYTTDLEILTFRDEAVDIPLAKAGDRFLRNGPAATCIRTGEVSIMDLDASYYGIAIKVICAPVFDDDEPQKIIGSFGVAIARDKAINMRRLVNIFEKGLNEIKNNIAQIGDATTLTVLCERKFNYLASSLLKTEKDTLKSLNEVENKLKEIGTIGSNLIREAHKQGDKAGELTTFAEQLNSLLDGCQMINADIKKLISKIEKRTELLVDNSDMSLIDSEEKESASTEASNIINELIPALKELQRIARQI